MKTVLTWIAALAVAALSLGAIGLVVVNDGLSVNFVVLGAGVLALVAATVALTLLALGRWKFAILFLALTAAAATAVLVSRLALPGAGAPSTAAPPRPKMLLSGVETWPGGIVPVCWAAQTGATHDDEAVLRAAVSDAERAWERVARVRFQDMGACRDGVAAVRLQPSWDGDNPETPILGHGLLARSDAVRLAFAFPSRSVCTRSEDPDLLEACVYSAAVHELGHVLGLPDVAYSASAPQDCKDRLRSDHPPLAIPYRPASVMNVCDGRHSWGRISDADVEDLREIYGSPQPVLPVKTPG